ncbi:MAG: aspartate 1-decarboxylase [Desulfohalobiaceae bacterium]
MGWRCFLLAKIHGARITQANVEYMGSIAICPDLLQAAGMFPNEQVDVYNLDNGNRLTTYVIQGEPGQVGLNGAAALQGKQGQRVIIAAYTWLESREIQEHRPRVVLVDQDNTVQHAEP